MVQTWVEALRKLSQLQGNGKMEYSQKSILLHNWRGSKGKSYYTIQQAVDRPRMKRIRTTWSKKHKRPKTGTFEAIGIGPLAEELFDTF